MTAHGGTHRQRATTLQPLIRTILDPRENHPVALTTRVVTRSPHSSLTADLLATAARLRFESVTRAPTFTAPSTPEGGIHIAYATALHPLVRPASPPANPEPRPTPNATRSAHRSSARWAASYRLARFRAIRTRPTPPSTSPSTAIGLPQMTCTAVAAPLPLTRPTRGGTRIDILPIACRPAHRALPPLCDPHRRAKFPPSGIRNACPSSSPSPANAFPPRSPLRYRPPRRHRRG